MKKELKETKIFRPDENTVVNNFGDLSGDLSVARIKVDGRHPLDGYFANQICDSMMYILEGTGSIFVKQEEYKVKNDTVVHIGKKEEYYFEGEFVFLYISTPPFDDNQLKVIQQ